MMKYRSVLLTICLASFFNYAICGKYPKNLPRCNAGDNECVPKAISEVLRKTKNGNVEMNLPPTDPLHIPQVNIIQDKTSTIAIELYFKDCDLYGIPDVVVSETVGFGKFTKGSNYEVHGKIPQVQLLCNYKVDGKVLILPITGSGKSNLTLDNVDFKIKFLPALTEKSGKEYLQISSSKFKFAFETTRLHLKLENLFNGNKALSDNMNVFLNDNWKVILEELKPAVRQALSKIFGDLISGVFDAVPYIELFNDTD